MTISIKNNLTTFTYSTASTTIQGCKIIRDVAASIVLLAVNEAIALVGIAYHTLAIAVLTLPAMIRLTSGRVPESMSWSSIRKNHVALIGQTFRLALRAPMESFSSHDRAVVVQKVATARLNTQTVSTTPAVKGAVLSHTISVQPATNTSTLQKIGALIHEHRRKIGFGIAAITVGATAAYFGLQMLEKVRLEKRLEEVRLEEVRLEGVRLEEELALLQQQAVYQQEWDEATKWCQVAGGTTEGDWTNTPGKSFTCQLTIPAIKGIKVPHALRGTLFEPVHIDRECSAIKQYPDLPSQCERELGWRNFVPNDFTKKITKLSESDDCKTINKTIRKMLMVFHPDKNSGCDKLLYDCVRLAQEASGCLSHRNTQLELEPLIPSEEAKQGSLKTFVNWIQTARYELNRLDCSYNHFWKSGTTYAKMATYSGFDFQQKEVLGKNWGRPFRGASLVPSLTNQFILLLVEAV